MKHKTNDMQISVTMKSVNHCIVLFHMPCSESHS